jgi:hypothetical protein
MDSVLRSLTAIILAFFAGLLIMVALEFLGLKIFPLPPGADPSDAAGLNAIYATRPVGAMLVALAGWALGTMGACWVATRLAGQLKSFHGLLLGVIFLCGTIMRMRETPLPIWFWILGIFIFFPATFLGTSLAMPRNSANSVR